MRDGIDGLVFVGLNSRVAALRSDTGQVAWLWTARKPWSSRYVSLLLLDAARLVVSVDGYTYCLDPRTGAELWFNELAGLRTGVASLAAWGTRSSQDTLLAVADEEARRRSND